jgi:hypothetical protein
MEEKIGEGLVRIGVMTKKHVEDVLNLQRCGDNRIFGEIAIDLGYINDAVIKRYLKFDEGCNYRHSCHFYNIGKLTPGNQRLKEVYCLEWPEKCAIFQQKKAGKPVSITLWPTGRLEGSCILEK